MIWGNRPPDATATAELPKLPGTIPNEVVTDDVLAGMKPTQTIAMVEPYADLFQPAKHKGGHRKPKRLPTAVPIGATAAAFVLVAWLATDRPDPAASPHIGPDSTATTSLGGVKPKVTRPPVRPAQPVVLRSSRPARAVPVRPVVVTPTPSKSPTPKATTPRPSTSATHSPSPSATPVITVTPTDLEPTTPPAPEEAQTTDTETPDDDA